MIDTELTNFRCNWVQVEVFPFLGRLVLFPIKRVVLGKIGQKYRNTPFKTYSAILAVTGPDPNLCNRSQISVTGTSYRH